MRSPADYENSALSDPGASLAASRLASTTGAVRAVTVAPNGDVTPEAGAAASMVSFDGLTFRAGT